MNVPDEAFIEEVISVHIGYATKRFWWLKTDIYCNWFAIFTKIWQRRIWSPPAFATLGISQGKCQFFGHPDDNLTIVVELCRAGSNKLTFMQYTLANCIISAIETSGTHGERFPSEDVEINFGQIQWRYTRQSRTGGGAAGNIAAGWNLQKNIRA